MTFTIYRLQQNTGWYRLSIGVFNSATFKRRLLVLCARKARHSLDMLSELVAKDPAKAASAVSEARALLLQASIQFRKYVPVQAVLFAEMCASIRD